MNNSIDIQRETPIKSSYPFLYEFFKIFSHLFFKKIIEKFTRLNSNNYPENYLKSISMNNLMKIEENNTFQSNDLLMENNKNIEKDLDSLNDSNCFNNRPLNLQNNIFNKGINENKIFPNDGKNLLLQQKSGNCLNLCSNYLNPSNSLDNNIFSYNQLQNIKNPNFNPIYKPINLAQNNFSREIKPTNFMNNINSYNNFENINKRVPILQVPLAPPIFPSIPNTIMPPNNIISNSIQNNLIINNNSTKLKENKNINNINSKNRNEIKNNNLNKPIKNNDEKKDNNANPIKNTNIKIIKFKENNNKELTTEKNIQNSTDQSQSQKTTPKIHKVIFSIKESVPIKDGDLLSKKRKRFIKNNKLVFVQMEENDLYLKNEIVDEDKIFDLRRNPKPRGSRFRGVSKNGSQWQVLIMVKKKKRYLGSFSKEEEAARAYDKVALQNHGNKAKTNYDYTKEEIEKILQEPKILKLE